MAFRLSIVILLTFALLCSAEYSFPDPADLATHERMPGILVKPDGSLLKDTAGWEEQRNYLKAMLEHYQYGHMPPVPKGVRIEERRETSVHDGKATQVLGTITINRNGKQISRTRAHIGKIDVARIKECDVAAIDLCIEDNRSQEQRGIGI